MCPSTSWNSVSAIINHFNLKWLSYDLPIFLLYWSTCFFSEHYLYTFFSWAVISLRKCLLGLKRHQKHIQHIWAVSWDFQQFGMCDQQRLRPAWACVQSDQSLCLLLEYSTSVKLLTEHHLEFLSLRGCTGSSESTLIKMPHCWKSHVTAHIRLVLGRMEVVALPLVFLNRCNKIKSAVFKFWRFSQFLKDLFSQII